MTHYGALVAVAAAAGTGALPSPDQVGPFVVWFGPVGVAFALLALLIGYFYRRDLMKKTDDLKELRDRHVEDLKEIRREQADLQKETAKALNDVASTNEKVAGAINMLGEIVRQDRWRGDR
jgi:hypothetical protein